MIYVPPGYAFGAPMYRLDEVRGGSGWGAGTFAGGDGSRWPSKTELELAEFQVRVLAGSMPQPLWDYRAFNDDMYQDRPSWKAVIEMLLRRTSAYCGLDRCVIVIVESTTLPAARLQTQVASWQEECVLMIV